MQAQHQAIRETVTHQRRENKVRHRDIASMLDISEGELIAAHAGQVAPDAETALNAIQLQTLWPQMIEALEPVGPVMALTRNASCVHEKTGIYHNANHADSMGLVLGKDIDLRLFYRQWRHGFAVSEETDNGIQRSLQFFDASGLAVHKIFLRAQSDIVVYQALVEHFAAADQSAGMPIEIISQKIPQTPDHAVDVAGFRQAWAALRDTHDFFGLLKRFSISRLQGLRLADAQFVQPVGVTSIDLLLRTAAQRQVPIMVFVSNPGAVQIHTGVVHNISVSGPWLNILDSGFNLHLRADHIASAWVVKKPTVDGIVTSLELFDAQGQTIAMLFGERKPGKPEISLWRTLIADIVQEASLCCPDLSSSS